MLNTSLRPLTTRMLAQSAYEELRRLIVSGGIAPGTRIHVDELAKQWEISRTPIREAISRLALVDLVTITRNSRTEVTQWSPRDMLERVELIASLATAAIPRQCGGPATKTRGTTAEGSTEVHDFLALCQALLARSDRRVSRSAVAAHFAPIAAHFYTTEVAHRFGIDLETDAEERRRLIAELDDAIRAEVPGRIRAAIDSYLRALARAHPSESTDPSNCDVHAHAHA